MSEMVERVARAIAESQPGRNWDTMASHGKDWWRVEARAAIAAMREPTNAMWKACEESQSEFETGIAWPLMIDAALTE